MQMLKHGTGMIKITGRVKAGRFLTVTFLDLLQGTSYLQDLKVPPQYVLVHTTLGQYEIQISL